MDKMNTPLALAVFLSILCIIEYFFLERNCNPLAAEKPPMVVQKEPDFKPLIIYYNRVGKCGSRSLINVINETATENGFNFVSEDPYFTKFEENELISNVTTLPVPLFFTLG